MTLLVILSLLAMGGPFLRCEGGHATWSMSEPVTGVTGNNPGFGPHRKRASKGLHYTRALHYGGSWYRNVWITTPLVAPEPKAPQWTPCPRPKRPRGKRLRLFSWNVRSLTSELWHELQNYAQHQQFDVLFLQSTGWNLCSTWQAYGYHIIHSGGSEATTGGVMLMISNRLCAANELSYQELLAGRLLHVRVKQPDSSLDLIVAYQHPWRSTLSHDQNMEARDTMWQTLHEGLSKLPFRNRLLLAGDFNASMLNTSYPDNKELHKIVQHHGLGSLHSSRPTQATYYSPQGNTQIDYVFGRVCQLDAEARQGLVDMQTLLAGWRDSLDHRPLICHVPALWLPWRRRPPKQMSNS